MSDLEVRYGQIVAVRGASFDMERGEFRALVGPNGAGKTSTLSAIAGIVPSRGVVCVGDVDVTRWSPERRAASGIAFVRDGRRLFGRLTVAQNLIVGATTIRGRTAARAAVGAILERFPALRERASQRAETLSGGEGQLLSIARALVAAPTVVLVDEPFQGLSQEATALVLETLRDTAARGAAVLLASPDPIDGARSIHVRHGAVAEVLA